MTISPERRKEIEAIADEDIDNSDIPATDAAFWADAELVRPDKTWRLTLRAEKFGHD